MRAARKIRFDVSAHLLSFKAALNEMVVDKVVTTNEYRLIYGM